MARKKQAAPLQREPSDFNRGPPESPDHGWITTNGEASRAIPAQANEMVREALAPAVSEQAGLMQLIICVGGIYISLYTF